MLVDLSLEELWKYKPDQKREGDFGLFWKETLKQASQPLNAELIKLDYIISDIKVYKIYYDGFENSRICCFYLLPPKKGPHPAIIWFHGYGGSKGDISFYLKWVLLGYAVLAVDIKGQSGESADLNTYPPPSVPGYMTKGIFDRGKYYYRGVYMDCVRAINFLAGRKEIDSTRICVTGASQGGGLSLAAAALSPRPKLVIADMPYLCHFRRAVIWAEESKNITYQELMTMIQKYPHREEELHRVLSYFDNLNLSSWIKAKTVVTCATRDTVCPPSTIFAVYNHIGSDKIMEVLPYYGHDRSAILAFDEKRLAYIKEFL